MCLQGEVCTVRLPIAELEERFERVTVPLRLELEPVEHGGDEVRFPTAFTGEAVAVNTGEAIIVEFDLTGQAEMHCGRCLKAFRLPLQVHAAEEFRRGTPPPGAHPGDLQEDDGQFFAYYDGDYIDLAETVRQDVLLELPMKPLCSANCKGLCVHCGHDLNEGPCGHSEEPSDPRFEALKHFVPEKDEV